MFKRRFMFISYVLASPHTQTHTLLHSHTDTHSYYFNASEGEALSSTAGGLPGKSRKH